MAVGKTDRTASRLTFQEAGLFNIPLRQKKAPRQEHLPGGLISHMLGHNLTGQIYQFSE